MRRKPILSGRSISPVLLLFSLFAAYLMYQNAWIAASEKSTGAQLDKDIKDSGVCPPFKLRDEIQVPG